MNTVRVSVVGGVLAWVLGAVLLMPADAQAQVLSRWVGTNANMAVAGNWSPEGVPSAVNGDSLVFDGASAYNTISFPYNAFSANNGLGDITLTADQVTNLTITCSGGTGGDIFRLLPGKTVSVAAGAGAFTWGASGSTFLINLGRDPVGNFFINDSTNRARIGSLASINVTGGPGGRAIFGGSGDWLVDAGFTASVNLGLFKTGAGTLTLTAANSLSGACAVSNGTLRITRATALGTGAFTVTADGTLDLTGLPDGAAVANAITGAGRLRVRASQDVTLNSLTPAGLTLQVDLAGLSQTTYTVLRKTGTTFNSSTFAAIEFLNGGGTTAVFDYGTVGELRLAVQALPDAVAWDGEDLSGTLWSAVANWAGDAAPAAWQRLAFGGATTPRATNVNDLATGSFNALALADQNWSLSGAALTLGNLSLSTAHSATLATPLSFVGDGAVTVANGGTLTLSGVISGERALIKNGEGVLYPSVNNTYSGGTVLNAGSVRVNSNNALGTGPLTFAGNADLLTSLSPLTLPNRLVVPEGVTGRLRRTQAGLTVYLAGGLSGAGDFEVSGQFTAVEFGTRINGDTSGFTGTLRVGAYSEFRVEDGNTPAGSFLPNGTLDHRGGNILFDISAVRTVSVGNLVSTAAASNNLPAIRPNRAYTHTLSVGARNEDGTYAGRLQDGAGTLALRKVGSGTQTLTGAALYSGATTVEAGTLRFDRTAAVPAPLGYWPMSEGAGSVISNAVAGGPAGGLTNSPAWITGPGGAGTYAVLFSGTNQWGAVQTAGHPLNFVGTGTVSVSAWVKTKEAGAWYRSIVSKFDERNTTPFWGLGWFNSSQLGMVARGTTGTQLAAHTGAAALDDVWHHLVGVREADNTLRVYLDGSLYASAAGPAGSCRDDRSLWICRHGGVSQCVRAGVAGIGVWDGALAAGQVRALYAASMPLASAFQVAAGATVQFAGGAQGIGSLADSGVGGGSVVLEDVELTVGRNGTSTTFSGTISGDGRLLKAGAGTLTLSGTCDAARGVAVTAGTLALDATGALGGSATNIVVSGGTLSLAGSESLDDASAVSVSGGVVSLAEGVSEVIGCLILDGVRQRATTYGSTASAAQVKSDTYFTGSGVLRIIPYGTLTLIR